MDIEKLIERLKAKDFERYYDCTPFECGVFGLLEDTATAIETLRAELARVTAERDAAVKSIPHDCKTCAYHVVFFNGCTLDHDCTNPDGGCSNNYDRWSWRGIKEG